VEWVCLPEAFIMTGAILEKSKTILEGLIVNKEKMKENLDLLKGLPLSEAVMMALSEKMGKHTAYELVYELSMKVHENGSSFKEELLNDSRVNTLFSEEEMEQLLDPCHHTGYSHYFSEKILNHHASQE
jgi:adenylosuccinate lyase